MKAILIAVAALFVVGCAATSPAACAKEDCYIVPKSRLIDSAKELWNKGFEAGKQSERSSI